MSTKKSSKKLSPNKAPASFGVLMTCHGFGRQTAMYLEAKEEQERRAKVAKVAEDKQP